MSTHMSLFPLGGVSLCRTLGGGDTAVLLEWCSLETQDPIDHGAA